MTATLSPEQRLLMACARYAVTNDAPELVEQAAGAPIDWAAFVVRASEQGLAPLVHTALNAVPHVAPEEVRHQVRTGYAAAVVQHKARFEPTLTLALDVLHETGLRPIVLKGGAVAHTAYPKSVLRTLGDVDLLVEPHQLSRANHVLLASGFHTAQAALPHTHHHLPPLLSPDRQFVLELHSHLVPNQGRYALNIAELVRRSEVRVLGHRTARVLASADALFHACIHLAFGHRYQWFPMRTLVDILAMSVWSDLDWDLLVGTTLESRAAGAVYWPLRLSRDWLGARVPRQVLRRLQPGSHLMRIIKPVIQSTYALDGAAPSAAANVLYNAIRELSLFTGCSTKVQLAAVLRALFPTPNGVGHLSSDLTRSHWRFWAYLCRPQRLARGAWAIGQFLTPSAQGSFERYDLTTPSPGPGPGLRHELSRVPGTPGIGL